MLSKFSRRLRNWGERVLRSVAFLPLPMLVLGVVIGIVLYYVEANTEWSEFLREELPSLTVTSTSTATTALNLLTAGLITLTVFTFTQIMTLFNQVANSYSPRLLPLLTGDRSMQFVLGAYLGAIVINIIVLLGIETANGAKVPALSMLFCAVLDVGCFMLFIYFVATISKKIQVTKLIDIIYVRGTESSDKAERAEHFTVKTDPPPVDNWYSIPSPQDGYLGTVNYARLSKLATKFGTRFYLGLPKGHYVPKYQPILETEHRLTDAEIEQALAAVAPVRERYDDWHMPSIRLLTEIAVRAMSPGINDPGTAIDALDKLTSLLGRLMHLPVYNAYHHPDGGEVWLRTHRFGEVLTVVMQELRNCCRGDALVSRRLYNMLYHLVILAGTGGFHTPGILTEIRALLADNRRHVCNAHDRYLLARDLHHHRRQVKDILTNPRFLRPAHRAEAGYA